MGAKEGTAVESIPRRSVIGFFQLLRCLPLAVCAVHSLTPAHCTGVAATVSPSPLSLLLHRCVVPVSASNPLSISSADAAKERESVAAAEADGKEREGKKRKHCGSTDGCTGRGSEAEVSAATAEMSQGSSGMRRREREQWWTLFDADSRNGGQHSIAHVLME